MICMRNLHPRPEINLSCIAEVMLLCLHISTLQVIRHPGSGKRHTEHSFFSVIYVYAKKDRPI